MTIRTQTFLDLSTAHLSAAAIAWLDTCGRQNLAAHSHDVKCGRVSTMGITACGYFMHAPEDTRAFDYKMPEELSVICDKARELGCSYVLFDSDADIVDSLPIFNTPSVVDFTPPAVMSELDAAKAAGVMLVTVVQQARDLIQEAITTHIYDADNGETPPVGCKFNDFVWLADQVIAGKSPSEIANAAYERATARQDEQLIEELEALFAAERAA